MKKAIVTYDNMVKEGESNQEFKANTDWLRGFKKSYGLHCDEKHQWLKRTLIST